MSNSSLRAICFDAVGTLIRPKRGVATVYAEVGRQFGSHLEISAIQQGFAAAFARQERIDQKNGWRTSEAREVERWRSIVSEVLYDVSDIESCFAVLYQHFGRSENWDCDPAAQQVIDELKERGYRVGIASNFDCRLWQVFRGFLPLAVVRPLVISSEVGWRKPATAFFDALGQAMAVTKSELLHVGDDAVNDYHGAQEAGCQALLLSPGDKALDGVRRVTQLAQVLQIAL